MARVPESDIVVVGAAAHPLRDAYHSMLRMPWWGAFAVIAASFLAVNGAFALAYVAVGGVHGAEPGSLRDAFFFSVQSIATIGYGAMYPESASSEALVIVEAITGLILTAVSTGIVFARFSQARAMLVFSDKACIAPMNGLPTLMFRVGNDRASAIFEATVRVVVTTTERTAEGVTFYRMRDLRLERDRSPALMRSWTVLHVIDDASPLAGATPESVAERELELIVSVVGTDETSLQPTHARVRYDASDILWGARPADILSELPDGRLQLDVRRFHDVVPTAPTEGFPFGARP